MAKKRAKSPDEDSDDADDASDEEVQIVTKKRKPQVKKEKEFKEPYPSTVHKVFTRLPATQRVSEREIWSPHAMQLWKKQLYVSRLERFRIARTAAFFDRRVTCIEWHPSYPNIVALASKGGDIVWFDAEGKDSSHRGYSFMSEPRRRERNADDDEEDLPPELPFLYGTGKGGSITAMRFHPNLPNFIFTSSIDGCVKRQDFEGRASAFFLDTMDREKWWTGLDITDRSLIVGKTTGEAAITDFDGGVLWSGKLHKGKIQHIEVHPTQPHIFVSAGNDKAVRIWDIRQLRQHPQDGAIVPLQTLPHNGNLNCATFSPVAPYTLLTTSQDSQIRLYSSDSSAGSTPLAILRHPHRPFQHITAIAASWHPSINGIFTIGRYPEDTGDRRTVDVYHYSDVTGNADIVSRMEDPRVTGIHCIAKFNKTGDTLSTCSGFTTYLWRHSDDKSLPTGRNRGNGGGGNDDDDDGDANERPNCGGKKKKPSGKAAVSKDFGRKNKKTVAR
ncbi:hypothetical protein SmJEL517_g05027 [Synchytrium microbalum]|uniref:Uncharacterized protein n=1 Tax=Synchytrium microbalum TaxID=1806994 RepID=A0A507BRH3_9FUNG|nr:uncharacterized protein SmJEL517_g05027 [Synchytrium microbalum]TPX31737.1 hypothetical protein SmJEL517_g05027 [Synchytrium microbalum]